MLKMRKEVTKNSFYARGGRVGVSIKATVTYVKHVTETSTEASAPLERQKIAAGKTSDPCGLMGKLTQTEMPHFHHVFYMVFHSLRFDCYILLV